jgi:hypothetical protein
MYDDSLVGEALNDECGADFSIKVARYVLTVAPKPCGTVNGAKVKDRRQTETWIDLRGGYYVGSPGPVHRAPWEVPNDRPVDM